MPLAAATSINRADTRGRNSADPAGRSKATAASSLAEAWAVGEDAVRRASSDDTSAGDVPATVKSARAGPANNPPALAPFSFARLASSRPTCSRPASSRSAGFTTRASGGGEPPQPPRATTSPTAKETARPTNSHRSCHRAGRITESFAVYAYCVTASPPLRVPMPHHTAWETESDVKRTDPSAMPTTTPPVCSLVAARRFEPSQSPW